MDKVFDIPVLYNNKELSFPGQLLNYGYSYKIEVNINGTKILFELDEERNWRALIPYEEGKDNKNISTVILKAIANSIDKIMNRN